MEDIEAAIRHGIQAGQLRQYVRQHGETGLAGLIRLADRHSLASALALGRAAGAATGCHPGLTRTFGEASRGLK